MNSDPRVSELLARSQWSVDPKPFVMIGVDRSRSREVIALLSGGEFCALIVDDLEITLFLGAENWAKHPLSDCVATPVRLLTFPEELPADLVGFLASVSKALAEAGVSILPLAANRRDHIFVPAGDLLIAQEALSRLSDSARG